MTKTTEIKTVKFSVGNVNGGWMRSDNDEAVVLPVVAVAEDDELEVEFRVECEFAGAGIFAECESFDVVGVRVTRDGVKVELPEGAASDLVSQFEESVSDAVNDR